MCSTGFYQSKKGEIQCSTCETGLFNRPKKVDLWFAYVGENDTLCGGDELLLPAEGMRSYLKKDAVGSNPAEYTEPSYQRAGWLGNATSAWLWDPQPIISAEDFTTVHNDSTGAIVRIDIKRVEYFGFKWKFLLKEGTDELISGDLPEQKDEVERVHGENYPDCTEKWNTAG